MIRKTYFIDLLFSDINLCVWFCCMIANQKTGIVDPKVAGEMIEALASL
jgi:hypothetical protein